MLCSIWLVAWSWSRHASKRWYSVCGFWGCDRLVSEPLVIVNLVLKKGKNLFEKNQTITRDSWRHYTPSTRLDLSDLIARTHSYLLTCLMLSALLYVLVAWLDRYIFSLLSYSRYHALILCFLVMKTMSGRGRGNVNMTPAQFTSLLNTVAAAFAAHPMGKLDALGCLDPTATSSFRL